MNKPMDNANSSNSTSVKPRPLREFALSIGLFILNPRFPVSLITVFVSPDSLTTRNSPAQTAQLPAQHCLKRPEQGPHSRFRYLASETKLIFVARVNNGVVTPFWGRGNP